MLMNAYVIRDKKVEVFHKPFFLPVSNNPHGEAERGFHTAVSDPQTNMAKYPEDYSLWYIGQYDDNQGMMIPLKEPEHLMSAIHCVTAQENDNVVELKRD